MTARASSPDLLSSGPSVMSRSERFAMLAAALRKPTPSTVDPARALAELIDARDRGQVWLAIAVLAGQFADESTLVRLARNAELEPLSLHAAIDALIGPERPCRPVRVVQDGVIIDVAHTVSVDFVTGIQRVVRESMGRWLRDHAEVEPVAWTEGWLTMRALTGPESADVGRTRDGLAEEPHDTELVVPWNSVVIIPELAAESPRSTRLRCLARFSRNKVGAVAYDLVPIVASATTVTGMPDDFARMLTAMRHYDRIATISHAVAREFEGWKTTLGAVGLEGPHVAGVPLPIQVESASDHGAALAESMLRVADWPMILVIGSHEPRKNHLPILHAAEMLWREGLRFSLTFIGGGSWGGDEFSSRVKALLERNLPVQTITGASDDLLWASYRIARFTVFPSLYEGFGLPVAESIAAGTPCITSGHGSMREIAEGGGALLVDPYSDVEIREAMRRLLTDDELLGRLQGEATGRVRRTWDDYAADLWDALVVPLRSSKDDSA